MMLMPIQVMPDGVLIPLEYLQNAHEFEFEVVDGHVLVRPKPNGQPAKKNWLSDLIGIAESQDPTLSERVEEILLAEIDKRDGWTLRPYSEEPL